MIRRTFLLLALATSAFAASREKQSAEFYENYSGFTLPADPVLPSGETHPSLWFRATDVAQLKAAFDADEFAASRWKLVQKLADLDAPVPPAPAATDKVEVIHKYYGALSIAARVHAFVSLFTNDRTAALAHRQRAIALLRRAYDGPIYQLDSNERGSAVDEIYRGSWLQNYAHAYDCVQPVLDAATDKEIRERLAREAQYVYENLYRWTPESPHNHLSKPAWGLGSMALTLSSDPRAKDWLRRAIEAANKNTRFFFSGDGIYREGSHYLVFSLTNFVPFLYHYRNVSGVDGFRPFQPAFEAMVEARNSRGWLPNIEDSYLRPTPTHLVAGAYRQARTRLHSSAPLAEILAWSYATCDLAPFEAERTQSGLNYTGASWDYPLVLEELLTHDATLKLTAPDVAPNRFLTGGQSYFRDSWTNQDSGQRYLLFHGVATADNHNHDDQLSFLLEAEGQLMCSDSGYSRGSYAGAERTNWYVTAAAHNTLTFDGKPPADPAPNQTPPSVLRCDEPGMVGEIKSAFFGQAANWQRGIFWLGGGWSGGGDFYVVADRVHATKPGTLAGYLHGGRGTLETDGARRTWRYAADRYGRAAQLHSWIAAPGAAITAKSGEMTYIKGHFAEFPYLQIEKKTADGVWLTLLQPAAADDKQPFAVTDRSTAMLTAFVVKSSIQHCHILAQSAGGTKQTVDDVETDGAFAIVRRTPIGRVLGFVVVDGTYLSVGGKRLWREYSVKSVARAMER